MSSPLSMTAQGDRELVMTRRFRAPRQLVFDAWTKPEHLKRWLGVQGGWIMSLCEIDLRVGGGYRYLWRNEDGKEMGARGAYREVISPARIVCTETFDDPWYEGEALLTNALEEVDGVTTCTLTIRYGSTETRDSVLASPMESGLSEGFAKLDELLAVLA